MKWLTLIVIVFASTFSAYALVDFKLQGLSGSAIIYSTTFENDVHVIRTYRASIDKMQELISEKHFHDTETYNLWIKSHDLRDNTKLITNLSFLLPSTEDSNQILWPTRNKWDESWEVKYSQWIESEVDVDFFKENNLVVDCADVAYSLRWIFSRINNLPMTVTFDGTKVQFNNLSFRSAWRNLKRNIDWKADQVFLASLKYMLSMVDTDTLLDDTIPVEVSVKNFRAGLVNHLGGHTQVLNRVNIVDPSVFPAFTFESTVPAAARTLLERPFTVSSNIRKFKTDVESNSGKKEDIYFNTFEFLVQNKIEKNWVRVRNGLLNDLVSVIRQRDNVVQDGFKICSDGHCIADSEDYDNWSTTSRDKRLLKTYKDVLSNYDYFSKKLPENEKSIGVLINELSITLSFGKLDVNKFLSYCEKDYISPDPNDRIELRWGLNPEAIVTRKSFLIKKNIIKRKLILSKAAVDTYKLDHEIKNDLAGIYDLCNNEKTACASYNSINEILGLEAASILFYSSHPLASLEDRWGEHFKDYRYKYIPNQNIQEIDDGYFLSEGIIYDINTNRILKHSFYIPQFYSKAYKLLNTEQLLITTGAASYLFDKKLWSIKKTDMRFDHVLDGYAIRMEHGKLELYVWESGGFKIIDSLVFADEPSLRTQKLRDNGILYYDLAEGKSTLVRIALVEKGKFSIIKIPAVLAPVQSAINQEFNFIFKDANVFILTKLTDLKLNMIQLNLATNEISNSLYDVQLSCSIKVINNSLFVCPSNNPDLNGMIFIPSEITNKFMAQPMVEYYYSNQTPLVFSDKQELYRYDSLTGVKNIMTLPEGKQCNILNQNYVVCGPRKFSQEMSNVTFNYYPQNISSQEILKFPTNYKPIFYYDFSGDGILGNHFMTSNVFLSEKDVYQDHYYLKNDKLSYLPSNMLREEESVMSSTYSVFNDTTVMPTKMGLLVIKSK